MMVYASSMRRMLVIGVAAMVAVVAVVVGVRLFWPAAPRAMSSENGEAPAADRARAGRANAVPASIPVTHYPIPAGAVFVAPGGDDEAAGTTDAPLRTVGAALRKVSPGGTVVLRAGVYREAVGGISKPFVLQPYPGEQSWLSGADVVRGWVADGSAWRHDGWDPRLCRTCFLPDIIDPAHPLAGWPDMVFVDGKALRQVASRSAVSAGTFFVDVEKDALYVGTSPQGHTVESAVRPQFMVLNPGAAGSLIRGVGFRHFASNQEYSDRPAMVSVNARRVTFEKDAFLESASTGILIGQPEVTVSGSRFTRNGLVGVLANRADGIKIVGNTVVGNNAESFAVSGQAVGAAGIKVTRTKRPYVARNVFRDNNANGWWCDLGCSDAVVVGNLAAGNRGSGLFYEVSTHAVIASNVLAGNSRLGLKIASADNVRVVNNTFVGTQLGVYNDPRDSDSDAYSAGQPWVSTNTTLLNNLMVGGGMFVDTADYKDPPRMDAGQMIVRSDGGFYARTDASAAFVSWWRSPSDVDTYASLADWRSATGREAHGTEVKSAAAALFVSPAALKFRLRPGVAAADGGQPLPADIARILGVSADSSPARGALVGPGVS